MMKPIMIVVDKEKLIADLAELRSRYPMQSHIRCQICRRWFRGLGTHLRRHSTTGADYKREYDVLMLVSDEVRQMMTRGKNAIAESERIWLLKYWGKDVNSKKAAREILGISDTQIVKWLERLNLPNSKLVRKREAPKLVIKRLQQCAREGKILRPWSESGAEQLGLRDAAKRYFGNWRNALRKAGLKKYINRPRFRRWSPELVIKTLRQRAREGKSLKSSVACRESPKLGYAARRHFGTWQNALRKAGLEKYIITASPNRWTPELIIKELRERNRKKLSLNPDIVKRDHLKLYRAVKRQFRNSGNSIWNIRLPARQRRVKRTKL